MDRWILIGIVGAIALAGVLVVLAETAHGQGDPEPVQVESFFRPACRLVLPDHMAPAPNTLSPFESRDVLVTIQRGRSSSTTPCEIEDR
jgi:hypothetical protein